MSYAEYNERSLRLNGAVKVRARPVAHEHNEQVALMQWAHAQQNVYPQLALLFAIPNGGLRSKITAAKLRAEGAKAGVSDLFLPVACGDRDVVEDAIIPYHGLWIEMKVHPNRPTREQVDWLIDMNGQGYATFIAYGWEEAKDALVKYLDGQWAPKDNFNGIVP